VFITNRTIRQRIPVVLSLALVPTLAFGAPASAAQADVLVGTAAWYWEDQQQQKVQDPSGTDAATLELPNPFCPGPGNSLGAPEQTCRAGRLPIEVRGGDYEEPNKVSAVAFDVAAVPLGSTVSKFTATFLEANDPQSRPVNAEDRELQACLVEEFFGEGEARLYKAIPRHTCSQTDPTAKRKPVKGDAERFQYTFDLTQFAKDWVDEDGAPVAAIILYPVEPKDAGPQDNSWRVVLDGPYENEGKSIKARISYTPPPETPIDLGGTDPPPPSGGLDDFGSTDTGGFGTTSSTGFGGDTPVADVPAEEAAAEEEPSPVAAGDSEPAAGNAPTTANETPWYVWASLLAGLMAFSMVRTVVLEQQAGIRPDGVLAQIRRLNAQRRGAAVAAEGGSSPFAPLVGAFASVGRGVRGLFAKLPGVSKKG
jgi:hypothetical protein